MEEASGSLWEASGSHWAASGSSRKLLEVFGKLLGVSGKLLGVFGKLLEVAGQLLGPLESFWESLVKASGCLWEASGTCCAALFVTLQNSAGRQELFCETFFPGRTRRAGTFFLHFKVVLAFAIGPNVVLGAWHL